jgi:(acyl-carrier-protein) S-malonyltransferase
MPTNITILKSFKYQKLIYNGSYCCVAGHSLGEYSALVANNSITFEDSAKLLKFRSKVMQESMPLGTGGMIALIGCS